jgi:hypothetical protein
MMKWIASALMVSLAAVGGIALRNRDAGPSEGVPVAPRPSRPGQVAAGGAKPPRGGGVPSQAVSSNGPAKPSNISGEYEVLLRQSLFSSKPLVAKSSPADEALALKGISQEGEQFIAFIEDAGGGVREVRAGEALGDGRVREITLHEVRFESGGQVRPIEVGQMLDGRGAVAEPMLGTPVLAAQSPAQQKKLAARTAATTPPAVAAPAKSPRPKTGDPAAPNGRQYTFGDPR